MLQAGTRSVRGRFEFAPPDPCYRARAYPVAVHHLLIGRLPFERGDLADLVISQRPPAGADRGAPGLVAT